MKLLFWLFVLSSLSFKTTAQTIKGRVINQSSDTLRLLDIADTPIKDLIVKDGIFFTDNLQLKPGYYFFRQDNELAYLYLTPKDHLEIKVDGEDFSNGLEFKGKGAERNNYLVAKSKFTEQVKDDPDIFYSGTERDFTERIKKLKSELDRILWASEAEDFFITDEKENTKFGYLLDVQNYAQMQEFYFGKEVSPSKDFLSPLSEIDFDNATNFDKFPMYRYLASAFWKEKINDAGDYFKMLNTFNEMQSVNLKIDVLISFYYSITKYPDKAEDYFKLIQRITPNEAFVKAAKEKLDAVVKTKKGAASPLFTYKDVNGSTFSLTDFKGKFVFIDVWATWCGPCVQQMPYLKKLEHRYKDNAIVFVSISVDEKGKYEKWKKMVEQKSLSGVQLFADNSFDSEFIKAYGISSIPRFILIDKDGDIVDSNMSKPSENATEELLDSLLKK